MELLDTVNRQSKEASILWSHHEETRELPGDRGVARRQIKICGVDRHGEREPMTGVWRRSDPPNPPPVKARRICINFGSDL